MATKKATKQLGQLSNYAGEVISLNMKRTSIFGIGDNVDAPKIWLTTESWCAKVPDGLTDAEANILATNIANGTVVVGKQWIPALDKDKSVMAKYLGFLDEHRTISANPKDKFKQIIINLMQHKKEGNYTALEIYRAMLAKEKRTKNRTPFLTYLQQAIDHYIGPVQLVEDFPEDPDNYTVTIDPLTNSIISTDKKNLTPPADKTFSNPKARSAAIDKVLGDTI